MLQKNCSKTTVGIKIRALRAVFNEVLEMGIIKREKHYPFGRRKYQIPKSKKIKKALEPEQLKAIYFYEPNCSHLKKVKDSWLFSYLGNGINPKDIVYLKNKDVQDNFITFIRSKTERTTRNDPKRITIFITEDMRE